MKTQSLVRAGKTSEKTLPGDWERNTSPLRPPDLLPPGDHLHCREPHSFPREDLGNIGHIEKLEFRIEDVSDHRVRVLQHHRNFNESQSLIRRLSKST